MKSGKVLGVSHLPFYPLHSSSPCSEALEAEMYGNPLALYGFGPQRAPSGDGRGKEWSGVAIPPAQLPTRIGRISPHSSLKLISTLSVNTSSLQASSLDVAMAPCLASPGHCTKPCSFPGPCHHCCKQSIDVTSITQFENINSYLPRPYRRL